MFSRGFLEIGSEIAVLVTFRDGTGLNRKERVQGRFVCVNVGEDENTFGVEVKDKFLRRKTPLYSTTFIKSNPRFCNP